MRVMWLKRWWLCLPLLVLALGFPSTGWAQVRDTDGDGVIAGDCSPLDPAVHPGATDLPDLTFEDTNCDGIDGDRTAALFVAKNGDDANPGTVAAPMATIAGAVERAAAGTRKQIYVAASSAAYSRVDIIDGTGRPVHDGIDIYGGYVQGTWERPAPGRP
jgi:hypothetical protein